MLVRTAVPVVPRRPSHSCKPRQPVLTPSCPADGPSQVVGGALVATLAGLALRAARAARSFRHQTGLVCRVFDEGEVEWFKEGKDGEVQVPLLLVQDVYFPGAPVSLPVGDASTKKLYDSMLAPRIFWGQ